MHKVDLKIAYLLMVHKNPEQVNMLVKQLLTDEQADIYIHIDRNNVEKFAGKLTEHSRVTVLNESVAVYWGDISQVDAMLILLKTVMESGKYYDFICIRSGQDLMVKNGFKNFLAELKGKSFFQFYEVRPGTEEEAHFKLIYPKAARKLHDSMHPYRLLRIILRKLYAAGINPFPNRAQFQSSIRLFTGAQWFTISFAMAEYILDYLSKNKWYYKAFREVYIPDTIFFNTIAMNSPFTKDIINKSLTFEKFGKTFKTNHHPIDFTSEYIREIENSGCYFARKFDINIDRKVIEYFLKKILA